MSVAHDAGTSGVMRAMVLTGHGGLDRYHWHEDWPRPVPGPSEILIKIGACGLNNTVVNTRVGWYSKAVTGATGEENAAAAAADPSWGGRPLAFPRIQGADAVGAVVAAGAEVDPALIGKRVMVDGWQRDWSDPENPDKARYFGSELNGGFAEYTVVDHRGAAVVESPLSDAELATFSCSYTTAEGMLSRASVGPSDTVLVPGASGGVGGALVQLARLRGARVIAMSGAEKQEAVAALGAARVLPRAPEDLAAALAGERIDVVADVVGGPAWEGLIDSLARGGRYVTSGAIAGPVVPLDLRTLYLRDLSFFGSTVVPPGTLQRIVGLIEAGDLAPRLAATYPLADLREAQSAFIEKRHAGNIVVVP
ncbi:MAG: zinc-binding dehydrogenase [Pseudomonadota bacterium]